MKKNKSLSSIIFLDNSVTSKNFACHFLHYDIFCLENFEADNLTDVNLFISNAKNNQQFNLVFCERFLQQKQLKAIENNINQSTVFLTTNIANYCLLKQQKFNCCFVECDFENKEKLNIKINQNINVLPENFNIKIQEDLISKKLAEHIINSSIGAVCLLKNKTPKQAILSYKLKQQILQLLTEQILLTNSVMQTVEKVYNLNFYKLLSGKGFANKIKQHFYLGLTLNKLQQNINQQDIYNSVQELLNLNYNNFVEMPQTSKIMQEINIMLQNNNSN